MIERSRVRIPAGTAGEFSSPGSTFCADSYFGIRQNICYKNPGHSAKSAGGRLQLKHAYTLRMWLLLNRASALVTTCP